VFYDLNTTQFDVYSHEMTRQLTDQFRLKFRELNILFVAYTYVVDYTI